MLCDLLRFFFHDIFTGELLFLGLFAKCFCVQFFFGRFRKNDDFCKLGVFLFLYLMMFNFCFILAISFLVFLFALSCMQLCYSMIVGFSCLSC